MNTVSGSSHDGAGWRGSRMLRSGWDEAKRKVQFKSKSIRGFVGKAFFLRQITDSSAQFSLLLSRKHNETDLLKEMSFVEIIYIVYLRTGF